MPLGGIIVDLDGTLVDTNGLHATAWSRAFEQHGFRVGLDRILVESGAPGDARVSAILGGEAERTKGDAIRSAQLVHFERMIGETTRDGVLPGTRELLVELRRRGHTIALTTSASRSQLALVEHHFRLPLREMVDHVVTSGDDLRGRDGPDGGTLARALTALGLAPTECALVADTPYDGRAAQLAGVAFLGVEAGGRTEHELAAAGARLVVRDPADLLGRLDDALHAASPQPIRLDRARLEGLMGRALEEAKVALEHGELPIGAILARGDGTVVASGSDETKSRRNKVAHAEIVTFDDASGRVSPDDGDLLLVCNLEPCVMCLGAAIQSGVDVVVFGMHEPADNATECVRPPARATAKMPRLVGSVLEDESCALFERWLHGHEGDPYVPYVQKLLGLRRQ